MLVVVPVLAVLVLLVGYGRTLQWGFLTGVLLFFAVAIPGVLVLLHLRRPSALDAAIRRMMFLGGASATLAAGSLLALLLRTPLLELHGVNWPG